MIHTQEVILEKHLIVNGYKVPNGFGGVAVRKACEVIMQTPGIPQTIVLDAAIRASGLNASTAGWITSPGNPWNGKSPATRLWERRKEGVFKCYPNEFTALVSGSKEHLKDTYTSVIMKQIKNSGGFIQPGSLVNITHLISLGPKVDTSRIGMFLQWNLMQLGVGDIRISDLSDVETVAAQLNPNKYALSARVVIDGVDQVIYPGYNKITPI